MMETLPVCTLAEWQTKIFPGFSLSTQDRRLAETLKGQKRGRLDIDEMRNGIRVRARSWVGVVQFQNFEVRVLPKLAGDNAGLVEMLCLTSGLNALRRNRGQRSLDTEESLNLFDLIALLFAEVCSQVLEHGLLYDYVERESDLPVLRGRLLINQQIHQHYGRIDRLACRYDDHLTDIIENQILASALAICRSRVGHSDVRLQIRRLHTIFSTVCTTKKDMDWRMIRLDMRYHRMNEHYREAHELAWILFECLGIEDLFAVGRTRSFAFLLDMNQLFEAFTTRFVTYALDNKRYRIFQQRRERSIIWDASNNRSYTHITPDLLIQQVEDGKHFSVDAKYKLYDEKRLSTGDIYQSFFYAFAYHEDSTQQPSALLLYPSSSERQRPTYLQIRGNGLQVTAHLRALPISITQAISEIQTETIGPASQLLRDIVDLAI